MNLLVSKASVQSVSVRIGTQSSEYMQVQYTTLAHNNPKANGNYAAIFQADSDVIPWGSTPLAKKTVTKEPSSGFLEFHDITLHPSTPYIVGYSLSPDTRDNNNNFCASAYIEKLDAQPEVKNIDLILSDIAPDGTYVRISYKLLPEYNPLGNNNWIGIWDARDDYRNKSPLAVAQITSDRDSGAQILDINMGADLNYNAIYFCGGWSESAANLDKNRAAAILTFSCSPLKD